MQEINNIKEILTASMQAGGLLDVKEYSEIDQALKNIEDLLNTNDIKIRGLKVDVDNLQSEINVMDNEQTEIDLACVLPDASLTDQHKNKILQNLHENCSLKQLENLEKQAKTAVQVNGILYKEVI